MNNFEQKTKFSFSYEELFQKSYNLVSFMERDLVEFEKLNLGNEQLEAFQSTVETSTSIPLDEELAGDVMLRTSAKQMLAESLKEAMKAILFKAELKWGKNDAKYRQFRVGSISQMKDLELSFRVKIVARIAEKFLNELSTQGLTIEEIQDLNQMQEYFVVAMERIYFSQAIRDIATQARVIQSNKLYDDFRRIRLVGKTIWYGKDEARYNDYADLISHNSNTTEDVEDEGIDSIIE